MAKDITERVAVVETKIDTILDNHLPHIQKKLCKVDNRLWWVLGTVVGLNLINFFI